MSAATRSTKGIFYLLATAAWLLAAMLAAELLLRLYTWQVDSANIYLPRAPEKMPPLELSDRWIKHNQTVFNAPVAATGAPCDRPLRLAVEGNLLMDEAWLKRFAVAKQQERERLAALHNFLAFEVANGMAIPKSWATWPFNQVSDLHHLSMFTSEQHKEIFASLNPGEPGSPARVALSGTGYTYTATSQVAALFPVDGTNPIIIASLAVAAPIEEEEPSPRWETPWFKYSAGYQDPHLGIYQTNSLGFADTETELPKPEDTYRIVCVGASTTNEGADMRSNYVNVLEEALNKSTLLNETSRYRRIDVVNCGVEGITSDRILRRMDDYLALEPNLILLLEGINDLAFQILSVEAVRPAAGWRKSLAAASQLYAWVDGAALHPDMKLVNDALRDATLMRFDAFVSRARDCGVRVALCTVPSPDLEAISPAYEHFLDINLASEWNCPNVTFRDYASGLALLNRDLEQLAADSQSPLIPIHNHFRGVLGGPHFFYDICHLYPLGYMAKAHIVARYLEATLQEVFVTH